MAAQNHKYSGFPAVERRWKCCWAHCSPSKPNPLQPGRICGFLQWWAGLYGAISPQIPCTAITPIYTSEPKAIRKERMSSFSLQARNLHAPFTDYFVRVAILFMASTHVGWKNKTLYALAACSWVLNLWRLQLINALYILILGKIFGTQICSWGGKSTDESHFLSVK